MYSNKLTYKQYNAICNIIDGLRKFNIEPTKYYDLSLLDETAFESTTITFDNANRLIYSLGKFLNSVVRSRC